MQDPFENRGGHPCSTDTDLVHEDNIKGFLTGKLIKKQAVSGERHLMEMCDEIQKKWLWENHLRVAGLCRG
jgi:hypothetical protein